VVIRVAMVEDHPIVQAGLSRILAAAPNVRLVETARTIEELHSPSKEVDVLLLDLHLPGRLQGLAGVRHMTDRGFRVLIVTGEDTSMEDVADAIAAGGQGYLTKDAEASEYLDAIGAVASGRGHIGARLAAFARSADKQLAASDPNKLTDREGEVAGLLVEGYNNPEIAKLLNLSERTIDGHVENIKQKIFESRRVRVAMKLEKLGFRASKDRAWKGDPNE
jgi:DNA-binding NarL/FixJ family response regulator